MGLAGGVGSGYHIDAWRVGADLRADTGQFVAEYASDAVDHVGLPRERAAGQHVDRTGADALDLLRQRLGQRDAVDDPLHRRVAMGAADHGLLLPSPRPPPARGGGVCFASRQLFGLQNASSAATSLRSPSKSAARRS